MYCGALHCITLHDNARHPATGSDVSTDNTFCIFSIFPSKSFCDFRLLHTLSVPCTFCRQSCVALCCSELQCATLSPHLFLSPDCSPLFKILTVLCTCAKQKCVAECCRVLQSVAVCCVVLQRGAMCCRQLLFLFMLAAATTASRPLLTVYMCNTQVRCSVLQCLAVCCIV